MYVCCFGSTEEVSDVEAAYCVSEAECECASGVCGSYGGSDYVANDLPLSGGCGGADSDEFSAPCEGVADVSDYSAGTATGYGSSAWDGEDYEEVCGGWYSYV